MSKAEARAARCQATIQSPEDWKGLKGATALYRNSTSPSWSMYGRLRIGLNLAHRIGPPCCIHAAGLQTPLGTAATAPALLRTRSCPRHGDICLLTAHWLGWSAFVNIQSRSLALSELAIRLRHWISRKMDETRGTRRTRPAPWGVSQPILICRLIWVPTWRGYELLISFYKCAKKLIHTCRMIDIVRELGGAKTRVNLLERASTNGRLCYLGVAPNRAVGESADSSVRRTKL